MIDSVLVGLILIGISLLLRTWGAMNWRLPPSERPGLFQNVRLHFFFTLMFWLLLVVGFILVIKVKVWIGVLALCLYFLILPRIIAPILIKLLKYDELYRLHEGPLDEQLKELDRLKKKASEQSDSREED